jgi:hypothetical protein
MKIKPKFRKNQRVYFLYNNEIEYGKIIDIKPYEYEDGNVLYYHYDIQFYDDEIITNGKNIDIAEITQACLYLDKKLLIKNLLLRSEGNEKYLEKELKRKIK